jgi:hypothetical protein
MVYQSDLIFILFAIRKHDLARSKKICFTYFLGPIYLVYDIYTTKYATLATLGTR